MSLGFVLHCPTCGSTQVHPHFASESEIQAYTCGVCGCTFGDREAHYEPIVEPDAQMMLPLWDEVER